MGYGLPSRDPRGPRCRFGQEFGPYVLHFRRLSTFSDSRILGRVVHGKSWRDHAFEYSRCDKNLCQWLLGWYPSRPGTVDEHSSQTSSTNGHYRIRGLNGSWHQKPWDSNLHWCWTYLPTSAHCRKPKAPSQTESHWGAEARRELQWLELDRAYQGRSGWIHRHPWRGDNHVRYVPWWGNFFK